MHPFPISCTTWTFAGRPLTEAIAAVAALGFEGVDIPLASQLEVDATGTAERRRVRTAVERAGLVFTGFHWAVPPGHSYSTPDAAQRARTVAYFKRVIEMADEMGVGYITLGCGYTHKIDPAWDHAACIRNARDSWEQWARHLEGKQVRVGLEVLSRLDVNVLNTVSECAAFLRGITGSNLGLTLDTYHMNIEENDFFTPISAHGNLIRVFQVSDNQRNAPGTGHLPWRDLLAMLKAVNYPGFLSFEIPPNAWGKTEPRDAERELAGGLRFLRDVMATL
jgi:D-psicose/D-tagatose/L-ribulose 3-epimerase